MSGDLTRYRNVQCSSATDSVQPKSGCTPPAVEASGEQRGWRTEPVLCSWSGFDRCLVKNSQCPAKASLVSRLTIRSSRDRFAASAGHGKIVARRGRKSVRLSSGVRWHLATRQPPLAASLDSLAFQQAGFQVTAENAACQAAGYSKPRRNITRGSRPMFEKCDQLAFALHARGSVSYWHARSSAAQAQRTI